MERQKHKINNKDSKDKKTVRIYLSVPDID